jgi:hypothetical protein
MRFWWVLVKAAGNVKLCAISVVNETRFQLGIGAEIHWRAYGLVQNFPAIFKQGSLLELKSGFASSAQLPQMRCSPAAGVRHRR